MDQAQATEIQKHLMDADVAMARAARIMFDLEKTERATFGAPLRVIDSAFDELFETIYRQYPELRPRPQEQPEISSPLRWADVILPTPVTAADLDKIIFSKLSTRLMKTARIVGDVVTECGRLTWPITPEIVGARIEQLSDEDRIDSKGDLRYWRHSEIRLKPGDPD